MSTSIPEQQGTARGAVYTMHDYLSQMTAKARGRCENESEAIQEFVQTIRDADGWDEIREYLRPFLRGDEDWPEVPNYRAIERDCDDTINREIDRVHRALNDLARVTDEQALGHGMLALTTEG